MICIWCVKFIIHKVKETHSFCFDFFSNFVLTEYEVFLVHNNRSLPSSYVSIVFIFIWIFIDLSKIHSRNPSGKLHHVVHFHIKIFCVMMFPRNVRRIKFAHSSPKNQSRKCIFIGTIFVNNR